ncbi:MULTISPECIES: DsbE family thiol:disulfide interchange protein [unclassified Meridianimarinicoccus]|uniref:DsbE family thiol:disulfide interchange protein n=1 Tax=unclassified Meridianimarinicoccus TaxID=2923344 RepID=UPI0018690AC0|nr:DsbE family thiol:disulfide interchange protein [Fluviibacterium sp. MJW13]
MARMSPLMVVPPVVFAGLAALFFFGMQRENPDALPTALAGKAAPVVQVTQLGDKPVFTAEMLQEPGVKLVNFWASWCAPCRVEHPILEALAAEGVVIHGVNYKDTDAKGLGFLAELGDPYTTVGADGSGRMGLEWGLYGVPETFVIDGDGRIVTRFAGPVTERALESTIRPAMEQAAN